jgi:hypothetical protein
VTATTIAIVIAIVMMIVGVARPGIAATNPAARLRVAGVRLVDKEAVRHHRRGVEGIVVPVRPSLASLKDAGHRARRCAPCRSSTLL